MFTRPAVRVEGKSRFRIIFSYGITYPHRISDFFMYIHIIHTLQNEREGLPWICTITRMLPKIMTGISK